ncbi:glycosyltransferase [Alkalihalobacillus alcalophilus]|nr:hypothetical protein [Alkalihalobacillus alcalophilus]
MAMAKPVICYISDYMKKNYHPDLPIISANPSNIYHVIKNTLNNLDALPQIGLKSRAYVEKNHDILKNTDRITQIYKSIL